jgi:hypothetical protein
MFTAAATGSLLQLQHIHKQQHNFTAAATGSLQQLQHIHCSSIMFTTVWSNILCRNFLQHQLIVHIVLF